MANDCIPLYEPGQRLTGVATAAITGKTFVSVDPAANAGVGKLDGTNIPVKPSAAGDIPIGVAAWDTPQGQTVTMIAGGVLPIKAGGTAIQAGDKVGPGAGGTLVGASTNPNIGVALADAGVGADCMVRLVI
jgi:predicted RecA/RadA family phage recombinase